MQQPPIPEDQRAATQRALSVTKAIALTMQRDCAEEMAEHPIAIVTGITLYVAQMAKSLKLTPEEYLVFLKQAWAMEFPGRVADFSGFKFPDSVQ
jgi:hypothetical protein